MTPAEVIALINATITYNGTNTITGPVLNTALQAIVGLTEGNSNNLLITVGSGGYTHSTTTNPNDTLTGTFFATAISEIVTNGGSFIVGVDFTQDTGTASVTWGALGLASFATGQVLIAKR